VISVSLILTNRSLALSECSPHRAWVAASCSSAAPSSGSRSPRLVETCACRRLDLQWIMNAELPSLAAVTLVADALGDRFGHRSGCRQWCCTRGRRRAMLDHEPWRTTFLMLLPVVAGAQDRWAKNEERRPTY